MDYSILIASVYWWCLTVSRKAVNYHHNCLNAIKFLWYCIWVCGIQKLLKFGHIVITYKTAFEVVTSIWFTMVHYIFLKTNQAAIDSLAPQSVYFYKFIWCDKLDGYKIWLFYDASRACFGVAVCLIILGRTLFLYVQ